MRVTDVKSEEKGGWKVMVGAIDGIVGDGGDGELRKGSLERVVGNVFVEDTGDGGLAMLFQGGEGERKVKYWEGDVGDREIEDINKWVTTRAEVAEAEAPAEERLEASCHCGGVRFHLLRLDDDTTKKHRASLCMCRSCRLSVGQSLTAWVMRIPFNRVIRDDGRPVDNSLFGTLRRYQSSEHKSRDFCSTCGASVLCYDRGRAGLVDVLLGVLQSTEGVRAKSWLEWDVNGIYPGGDVVDKDLQRTVEENYKRLG